MRFCWMCDRLRANEAFSGRNRRRHLCRQCARRPRTERERGQKLRALWQILHRQSNISEKNIRMCTIWANDSDPEVATLAGLAVDIGRLHPRRRKRYGYIRHNDAALFQRMIAAGLAFE